MAMKDGSNKGGNSNNEGRQLSLDLVFTDPLHKNKQTNKKTQVQVYSNKTTEYNIAKQDIKISSIPPDKLNDIIYELKSKTYRTLLYLITVSLLIAIINTIVVSPEESKRLFYIDINDQILRSLILAILAISILYFWSQLYLHISKIKNSFIALEKGNQEYLDIAGFYNNNINWIEKSYVYITVIISIYSSIT